MSTTPSLTDIVNAYQGVDLDTLTYEAPSGDDLDSPERIEAQLKEGVKRGQVWLAVDDTADDAESSIRDSLYVMIVEVNERDPRLATVIPLSNDLRAQTEDSLVIEEGSPLEIPTVAWPKIHAIIPVRLLSKPLKQFKPDTVESILSEDPSLADADDTVVLGFDHEDNESPYVENREDAIATLVKWHARCFTLPKLHSEEERESMTPDRAKYARALVQVLGLSFDEVNEVFNGQLALSTIQEQQLSEAGIDAKQLRPRTFNLPKGLLIEIEQPLYRSMANEYATRTDTDPRVALAKDAFALAARKNGYGASAWRGAIQQAAQDRTKTTK